MDTRVNRACRHTSIHTIRRSRQDRPALTTLAVPIGGMLAAPGVYANPTGGNVVGGAATVNGGRVDTTVDPSYGEHVVLGADPILAGPIGAHQALASVSISGDTQLGAGSIATVGDQQYDGNVSTASAAQLYGSINGHDDPLPASMIDSQLVASPYFMNDTPWGPSSALVQLAATTTPIWIVPSMPTTKALFTRAIQPEGFAPNVLSVFIAPQVLTIVPAATPSSSQPDSQPHAQRKAEEFQASASQSHFN